MSSGAECACCQQSIDGEEEEGGRLAEGTGSLNKLQIWGTATAAMLFAAGVTWTADQLNLVRSHGACTPRPLPALTTWS